MQIPATCRYTIVQLQVCGENKLCNTQLMQPPLASTWSFAAGVYVFPVLHAVACSKACEGDNVLEVHAGLSIRCLIAAAYASLQRCSLRRDTAAWALPQASHYTQNCSSVSIPGAAVRYAAYSAHPDCTVVIERFCACRALCAPTMPEPSPCTQ